MKKILFTILVFAGMMTSCSDETVPSVSLTDNIPISISAEYPVKGISTRATDNGFQQDDAVGLFIVDYNPDGTPGTLQTKGNRADNVRFGFDGVNWTATHQLYWANKHTPADFYGYYPFNVAIQNAEEHEFSVYVNQNETTADKSNYEQSDLLWAKAEKVQPTADCIPLRYNHLMAGITVQLQMGTGFDVSEWAQTDKTVLIDNVITASTVNLQAGKVTAKEGAATDAVVPLVYNNVWRAVVAPQTIEAGKRVLNITVDGKSYELVKETDIQFISGKMHNFTITVNRNVSTGEFTFELTADDIVAWLDDADLHDGLVRQYIIVNVSEAGTLANVLAERGIDYTKVTALKVIGNVNHCDLTFMGQQMTRLTDLNLAKVILCADEHEEAGVLVGFAKHFCLYHIVFPEKSLIKIGRSAFRAAGLTGSLTIPEGVVEIDQDAFGNNVEGCTNKINAIQLTGTLSLPSTLKKIGNRAFTYQGLYGELKLPEGLEYMGDFDATEDFSPNGAFPYCSFCGSLNLPSSLKEVVVAPSGNFTGNINVPAGVSCFYVPLWFHANNAFLELHEGLTDLNISNCGFAGELILPSTMKKLAQRALSNNKFSKIVMSDNIMRMDDRVMADNPYLTSVVLSKNLACIPPECFKNCSALQSITIPANIDLIKDNAFQNCNALNSIVCEGIEPPVCTESSFNGVNKDNFTVEVPKGCVNKYKEADGWKEFKRIAEYSNFVCRPAHANALNKAHSETIVLNADGAWTVKHVPDWIHLSKTSGTGKAEIQLAFLDMPHGNGNRQDRIVFEMDDHETYCDVSQYDYEYEEDGCLTLQNHSQGNGIDLVFMGDGWTGEDISSGSYLDMVREQTEYFFGIEPYKSHRDYFNVYVTFPLSQEKGVNTMHTYVNNRFGTLYGYDGTICTINQLLTETDEAFQYAVAHSPMKENDRWKAQLILIPNSDEYEGITYYDGNCALSLCPPSSRPYPQDTRGVVQHEACGHGFGKLGDENISKQKWATPDILNEISRYHGKGWMKNLATTSKMSQVAWADFIYDLRYSDQVDVFEGGYGYMRGVFRCENNSCMNYGIPYFNAISRLEIMRRIREYSGTGFSMDYFYAHDTNKWGDREGLTRSGAAYASLEGNAITSSNMHCPPKIITAKKMGDNVRRIRKNLKRNNNR
ncbi:MAG: fimbrillin family protein [Paraprevotella sp.]|nr:fimbrillin family protein [Paraprevotella sp.]